LIVQNVIDRNSSLIKAYIRANPMKSVMVSSAIFLV